MKLLLKYCTIIKTIPMSKPMRLYAPERKNFFKVNKVMFLSMFLSFFKKLDLLKSMGILRIKKLYFKKLGYS